MYYTKEHEWIKDNGDGTYTVGITKFAAESLGDIVYVENIFLKDMVADEVATFVESVKAASDIYVPASGEFIEYNKNLDDNPELVSNDPENEGWIWKQAISNPSDISSLMNEEEYEEFCKG